MFYKIDLTDCEEIKELVFPLKSESCCSYYEKLEYKFQIYNLLIKKITENNLSLDKSIVSHIKNSCTNILDCIKIYHQGEAGASYNKLVEVLKDLFNKMPFDFLEADTNLFRMRISQETISENENMFHIPFNMRYLVESRRYSIAGLPCLYLGSSHFICWYELQYFGKF